MVYAAETGAGDAVKRVDLEHLLYIFDVMDKLSIVKHEMSQCSSWRGYGYFWPHD